LECAFFGKALPIINPDDGQVVNEADRFVLQKKSHAPGVRRIINLKGLRCGGA